MKVTKILSDEHKNILKIAEALLKKCDESEKGKLDIEFWQKAIEFIRNYADKFHHAKEEDILFKEFCKAADEGCAPCNPVEQMLYEHNLGRDFVKAIEQGLKEKNKAKIIENAKSYAELIQQHIFKEDNILYPMADEAIEEKSKKSIAEKFEKINKSKEKNNKKYLNYVKNLK